jgi:proteasome component ECM29
MAHIWRALVPEPKKALEAHFGAVAAELLREMGGRLWRSREAACAALADLLQARRDS